jgi:two-component system response regulator YesN
MHYESELQFFLKLLKNLHLNPYILQNNFEDIPVLDLGLRQLVNPNVNYKKTLQNIPKICKPNQILRIYDEFLCNYIIFLLPETTQASYIIIGPYSLMDISQQTVLEIAEKFFIPAESFPQLRRFYQNLPFLMNESILLGILSTFGEIIWGGPNNFTLQDVHDTFAIDLEPVSERPNTKKTEEALLSMKVLEELYQQENALMQAVSQGHTLKAEMFMNTSATQQLEPRVADAIQNLKNYTIILNTVLRKAAERGSVHPLHIDSLSSKFAQKIQLITSHESCRALQKEMVHKYCLLVKNNSMKGYSPLIQRILTRIDSDLTADLSLKTQAELLNVNPSYLSNLFKKETGSTLTDYVNRKRIEYSIFLLNSTSMQIQAVAQYCGISDVNYFTKIFKKQIGKTPTKYRDSITTHLRSK